VSQPLTPTEAGREAYLAFNNVPPQDAANIRAGHWDQTTGMQIIARHAQAARLEGAREMKHATLRACADQSYMDPPRNTASACCERIREIDPVEIASHTITGEAG
jgi:hypothetical protein